MTSISTLNRFHVTWLTLAAVLTAAPAAGAARDRSGGPQDGNNSRATPPTPGRRAGGRSAYHGRGAARRVFGTQAL